MKNHSYLICPLKHKNFYDNEVVKVVEDYLKDIPNKFLYLGYHGASLWNEIDEKYKPAKDGTKLIEKHFKDIDCEIRNSIEDKSKSYDIVSLGCGSGKDDKLILDQIQDKFQNEIPPFKIFTVDLSYNLLVNGTEFLINFLNLNATDRMKNSVEKVHGIWGDIEELPQKKDDLKNNILLGKRRTLYHLLGLTLGNNDEIHFLKSIYNLMNINDFLLLGLDFSESYGSTDDAYNNYTTGDVKRAINKFLGGPLIFCSKFEYEGTDYNQIKLNTPFQIVNIEQKRKDQRQLSKIPDSVSFTRYHIYNNGSTRLCDYSTKYNKKSFEKFINVSLPDENVYFDIVGKDLNLKMESSSQELILLKKIGTLYLNKERKLNNEEINDILEKAELNEKDPAPNPAVKGSIDMKLLREILSKRSFKQREISVLKNINTKKDFIDIIIKYNK